MTELYHVATQNCAGIVTAVDGRITDAPLKLSKLKGMLVEDFGALAAQKGWSVKFIGSNRP